MKGTDAVLFSVGEKMVDFMEEEPVRFDQAAVDILTRLKRELGGGRRQAPDLAPPRPTRPVLNARFW